MDAAPEVRRAAPAAAAGGDPPAARPQVSPARQRRVVRTQAEGCAPDTLPSTSRLEAQPARGSARAERGSPDPAAAATRARATEYARSNFGMAWHIVPTEPVTVRRGAMPDGLQQDVAEMRVLCPPEHPALRLRAEREVLAQHPRARAGGETADRPARSDARAEAEANRRRRFAGLGLADRTTWSAAGPLTDEQAAEGEFFRDLDPFHAGVVINLWGDAGSRWRQRQVGMLEERTAAGRQAPQRDFFDTLPDELRQHVAVEAVAVLLLDQEQRTLRQLRQTSREWLLHIEFAAARSLEQRGQLGAGRRLRVPGRHPSTDSARSRFLMLCELNELLEPPLAFTEVGAEPAQATVAIEGQPAGQILRLEPTADGSAPVCQGLCGGAPMRAGVHQADFTIRAAGDGLGPSVGLATDEVVLLPEGPVIGSSEHAWSWTPQGAVCNRGLIELPHNRVGWGGGDTLSMRLDLDHGTLTGYVNGRRASILARGPSLLAAHTQRRYFWCVEMGAARCAVEIRCAQPAPDAEAREQKRLEDAQNPGARSGVSSEEEPEGTDGVQDMDVVEDAHEVSRGPELHAGGLWRLRYSRAG